MRDLFLTTAGVAIGAIGGVTITLLAEGVVVGAVLATLAMTRTPVPESVPVAATVPVPTAMEVPVTVVDAKSNGELQLMTTAAIQPFVDGVPMVFDPGQGFLAVLAAGTHRVEVLDLLARPVATLDVQVVSGQRSQLRWSKKVLTDLGRVPRGQPRVVTVSAPSPSPAVVELTVDEGLRQVEAAIDEVDDEIDRVDRLVDSVIGPQGQVRLQLPRLGLRPSGRH